MPSFATVRSGRPKRSRSSASCRPATTRARSRGRKRFARDNGFDANDPARLVRALLQHIRTGNYSYTLVPGTYGVDAIDEFWLDQREGFCEHYAASFVVILRAIGVPARIVTGYQGAEGIPVDGYYIVRQSSAHAWAEYWQRGVGWVRADPTAAVAPDRINGSRRLVPQPSLVAGAIASVSPELLAQLRANWETLNNRWNQWVLSYSRGQQLEPAEERRLQVAVVGRPDLAADRRAQRLCARRRGLGLVGPPPDRSVDAADGPAAAQPAIDRRRRGAARAAAHAGGSVARASRRRARER